MASRGKLVIVFAPSGSGKGTLIEHVKNHFRNKVVFPVSYTTRAIRPGEQDGDVYHFVSKEDFKEKINGEFFLEWAEYSGNLYGTPRDEITEHIEAGDLVLREVEIQGANSISRLMPKEDLISIYIDAGSWEDLRRRIEARAPLSEEELELRRRRFEKEILFKDEADFVISNKDGELESAQKRIIEIIENLQ